MCHIVNFKNSVVILTSNTPPAALKSIFRPEFLNRIDETITFHDLSQGQLRQIVDLQLAALQKRLADRRITLDVADGARDLLAREEYDPQYGARPLRRLIRRKVQNPLAMHLLEGKFRDGDAVIVTCGSSGDLMFSTRKE